MQFFCTPRKWRAHDTKLFPLASRWYIAVFAEMLFRQEVKFSILWISSNHESDPSAIIEDRSCEARYEVNTEPSRK